MDKSQFEYRFERMIKFIAKQYKHATDIMPKDSAEFLSILPILLHYNHKYLPGYRNGSVPHGIDMFVPNEKQREYLRAHNIDPDEKVETYYPIYGLYSMGSTSTIAQGPDSDLDIWVCISKETPDFEINRLSEKCRFISAYAKALGVELNLFVTVEDRFANGSHGTMDTEDCGSAQSLFLLDEFYRTSMRLCGRYIAWYMISSEDEYDDYQKALKEFYQSDFIVREQWFDFGSVAKCSPEEYFGSGLWLVYKGIDRPFKALLKILLMEAYASEYPNTRLLSLELKDLIFKTKGKVQLKLDPYYLMFKKVSGYLLSIGDFERIDLVRISFYSKIKNALDQLTNKRALLRRQTFLKFITKTWKWSESYIDTINNPDKISVNESIYRVKKLFLSLLESYKSLLRFCMDHNIEFAITSDDAGVLSRKIYSAYEKYPGKIVIIKSALENIHQEKNLTLVKPSKFSLCNHGWHVFANAQNSIEILESKALYVTSSIVEMVCWVSANGLLGDRTNLFIKSPDSSVTEEKIKALCEDIRQFILSANLSVKESDLQKPRQIIKSMVVVNFHKDATSKFMISTSDLEIGSALSLGRQKMCLIGSVDVINLNSWGEISCNSFSDGESGIADVLASLIKSQKIDDTHEEIFSPLEFIKVCSYSDSHRDLIRYDLEAVIRGIYNCINGYDSNHVFALGHNTYEVVSDADNNLSLVKRFSFKASQDDVTILSRFGMRPEYALQVPDVVERSSTEGIIQYFFVKHVDIYDIYIVNERNEVKIYRNFKGSRTALVNEINRFYAQEYKNEDNSLKLNFNLPQYFVLNNDMTQVKPFSIMVSQDS